ncbi:hypothetical protein TspCOW1_18970 [Thiohalobacter sp. COW1]|uniref:hypothetical protein n=1 Tax=Thiohalobacter sp. COW1 TaxID=2795687 RepID=UPI0019162468|nr:hypothetical protein [Thiohalobacter sp. COW1]BCO31794.1 hypothetical protein TspCOW1_18970 [Thiohalobacter sp. COW1]
MAKNNNVPAGATGVRMQMYVGQALAGCGLLLAVAVQARFLASVFDHEIILLAIGAALFGADGRLCNVAAQLSDCRGNRERCRPKGAMPDMKHTRNRGGTVERARWLSQGH